RAMNRIYDTRQGRPFVYFRFVVFIETVVLITASLALLVFIILGGDFSVRLGKMLGLTQETDGLEHFKMAANSGCLDVPSLAGFLSRSQCAASPLSLDHYGGCDRRRRIIHRVGPNRLVA